MRWLVAEPRASELHWLAVAAALGKGLQMLGGGITGDM